MARAMQIAGSSALERNRRDRVAVGRRLWSVREHPEGVLDSSRRLPRSGNLRNAKANVLDDPGGIADRYASPLGAAADYGIESGGIRCAQIASYPLWPLRGPWNLEPQSGTVYVFGEDARPSRERYLNHLKRISVPELFGRVAGRYASPLGTAADYAIESGGIRYAQTTGYPLCPLRGPWNLVAI